MDLVSISLSILENLRQLTRIPFEISHDNEVFLLKHNQILRTLNIIWILLDSLSHRTKVILLKATPVLLQEFLQLYLLFGYLSS